MSEILDKDLSKKLAPRYTSYPTAPHFSSAIGRAEHEKLLASVSPAAKLSVYIHVPYCTELCHYCGCNTKATQRRQPIEAYAKSLVAEFSAVSKILNARRIERIHWGGGTPSILGAELLKSVMRSLSSYFRTGALREHAIELDPRRVDPALAEALAEIHISRANLGVQVLSTRVQESIGRIQPFSVVERAGELLAAAGITEIGVDLMYGLPGQTEDDILHTAELVSQLKPRRVAIFGYAHVPWFKKNQRLIDAKALPTSEERLAQAELARTIWMQKGYLPVGIDHFALPDDSLARCTTQGGLRRNFQGYTDDTLSTLIGFGASAISRFREGYVQNHAAVSEYATALTSGRLPTAKGIMLTDDDRLRSAIIESLMCNFFANIDRLVVQYGHETIFSSELAQIDRYCVIGFARRQGRKIWITEAGRPYARVIASAFDSYFHKGATRHSRAV